MFLILFIEQNSKVRKVFDLKKKYVLMFTLTFE